MENNASPVETLIEKIEDYSKTSFELYKCQAVAGAAGFLSNVASKLIISVIAVLFLILLSIGAALWMGELLNEPYYGFFVVSLFYLLIGLLVYLFRNDWLKTPISNKIIRRFLNEKLQ